MNLQRVRQALTGPIASIRTPFRRDGAIDYPGVRRMIDFHLQAGGRVSLLTAGDSHFHCLTDDEIAQLNRVVVEHTAGRALTVACDWEFATPQAVRFAAYCADLGADILMARPPDWAESATADALVEHYARLAKRMPIMLVTNLFLGRSDKFTLNTLTALRDRVPNILALKEDLQDKIARRICLLAHGRWAMFSGGGLRKHLDMHAYGCDGFMDRHMNFAPAVSFRYWNALQKGDLAAARKVIADVELPLEDFLGAFPGGRDAAVHGLIELAGIAGRWRRKPYHSLTDAEMRKLKSFVKRMGLL
jgi:4-hydroxy-tetrahydrodipicolinate synthase